MTHIAFVNIPAHGHVNPTLGVVQELVKHGARVSYALPEGFAEAARQAGAEPKPYHSQFEIPRTFTFPPDPKDVATMPMKLLDEAVHVLPQLEQLYGDDRPDVVCYDFMATAGQLFAEKARIPAVKLCPSYAANETFSLAKRFFSLDLNDPQLRAYGERLMNVLKDNGLAAASPLEYMTRIEAFNIVFMPRAFQYEGASFDERFLFVGPCLRPAALDGAWEAPANDRPTLLISLGTVFNNWPEFFQICAQAFANAPWNVVMAIGSNVDPTSLGDMPPNFDVRPHVPQLSVLPKAQAFITHGGMNSTMEGLYHDVPLVVIPQMTEQQATALRVNELELGRYLPRPEVTVETLRRALADIVEDQTIAANVQRMGKDIRAAGGASAAAAGILGYVAGKRC